MRMRCFTPNNPGDPCPVAPKGKGTKGFDSAFQGGLEADPVPPLG